jgi:hypothetical protein
MLNENRLYMCIGIVLVVFAHANYVVYVHIIHTYNIHV